MNLAPLQRTVTLGSLFLAAGVLVAACRPPAPAAYSDRADVQTAHKKWCAMIDALPRNERASYQADCEAVYPTASAAFLGRVTPCYKAQIEEYGDDAPDSAALMESCSQEVLMNADPGDVSNTPVVKARCARMQRCDQVELKMCQDSFAQLDGMSRALLTSVYNLRAQTEIAACIEAAACDDEDADNTCYRGVRDKLVWLPIHLGRDPGLAPDPLD